MILKCFEFTLNQDDKNNQKANLEKIKDSVRYGDFTVEGNIHKILSLKKIMKIFK